MQVGAHRIAVGNCTVLMMRKEGGEGGKCCKYHTFSMTNLLLGFGRESCREEKIFVSFFSLLQVSHHLISLKPPLLFLSLDGSALRKLI